MAGTRYKAFISYSHRDERWARWLHNALESYRVPKSVVGSPGYSGPVPARFRPVFRDRVEFHSAADLGDEVQSAIARSDSLIVICSPAASGSRWVNEEIRYFRSLGRGDRIFCMVVDGDPQADDSAPPCFPPALLETDEGEVHEPLAADARKWADGKTLAKLKLLAGILGVRLDELRQRDLQRRRRRQAFFSTGVVAALGLALMTFFSAVSERQQRERSEELAGFVVELGQELESRASLETLGNISERMYGYLETLDQRQLTPETRKQIALVLRQMGEVARLQGKSDTALEALTRSRDIISKLSSQSPGNTDFLFELGNAEFYIGNLHLEQRQLSMAQEYFEAYQRSAAELVRLEPDNADWLIELSSAHTNIAIVQKNGNSAEDALANVTLAVSLAEKAMSLAPENEFYRTQYATMLAWSADTHMQFCDLGDAMNSRLKTVQLTNEAVHAKPGDNNRRRDHAYALTGLANIQRQLGLNTQAMQNLESAWGTLNDLAEFDPGNLDAQWEALEREALIYDLLGETGDLDRALRRITTLREPMQDVLGRYQQDHFFQESQYAHYLISHSDMLWRSSDAIEARDLLEEVISTLVGILAEVRTDEVSQQRLSMTRFLWWQQNGEDLMEVNPAVRAVFDPEMTSTASCLDIVIAAKTAILRGDRATAGNLVSELRLRGYYEPAFVRFCTSYDLC
jgi:tetratricopeptide (TPR) repeat protein